MRGLPVSALIQGFSSFLLVWGLVWLGLAWLAVCAFCEIITFSKISGWFGVGLGLVWLGLARCWLVERLCFPRILLGLGLVSGLVRLGLAMCVFCEILTLSNRIAWFGAGLAGFGLVLVGGTVVFFKNVVTYALCRLQLQPSTFIQLDTYVCE